MNALLQMFEAGFIGRLMVHLHWEKERFVHELPLPSRRFNHQPSINVIYFDNPILPNPEFNNRLG